MKLCEIYSVADAIAPKSISDAYCARYGAYDNSGVLIDVGEDIKGVLFSLDLSFAAIEKAKAVGANLIVTHHPAIYGKISDMRIGDFNPVDEKLLSVIKRDTSIVSMHLNLDMAQGGIDECLMNAVCDSTGAGTRSAQNIAFMHEVEQGAYGRAYDVADTDLATLMEGLKITLNTQKVLVYGHPAKRIRRVASFCGAGADEEAVAFACKQGADVIVSSDFKHHVIALAIEKGLAVVALTHYASEQYGFEKYYKKIRESIGVPCVYHADENLL